MQTSAGKRLFSMVVTLVCLVAAAVVFFQFVRPAYSDTQAVRAEVISRQDFLDDQRASIEAAQKIIQKYQSDTQVQETVSRVLPATPDLGGALYQLTSIASQYNVQVLSTTAQTPQLSLAQAPKTASSTPTSSVRPLGIATFQVKFNARYDDLKAMLEKLESNVRLMDITAVSVAPSNVSGVLAVDLTVATYYQVSE